MPLFVRAWQPTANKTQIKGSTTSIPDLESGQGDEEMCRRLAFILITCVAFGSAGSTAQAALDYFNWLGAVAGYQHPAQSPTSPTPYTVRLYDNGAPTGISGALDPDQVRTYGTTNGGEFRVQSQQGAPYGALPNAADNGMLSYVNADGDLWVYKTFCLERNEFITLGSPYSVSIDDRAYYGANVNDGGLLGDPLSRAVKILYGNYFQGTLDDVVAGFYDPDTSGNTVSLLDASGNALQQAIWAIEDNLALGSLSTLGTALYNYATTSASSGNDFYDNKVRVLNLWSGTPAQHVAAQSQLVWVGPSNSTTEVPEPGSMLLWALGIAVGGCFSRRALRSTSAA